MKIILLEKYGLDMAVKRWESKESRYLLCRNTGAEEIPCDKLCESEHQASQQNLGWEPSSSKYGLFGFSCCYQLGSLQKRCLAVEHKVQTCF